ncbi:class I SAM-dependent methyltransferase [Ghiorsea bivora]|uniref:class I SAM-dependent methyltransferase n=1 Tax=Ghiorsea bivora TaxID=1485545 RepID=UPI000570FFD9|nr:class I SAM-dependent methyltransferase [Ghiorsea bivora]
MTDLFENKAGDWDKGDMKQMLSQAIGGAMVQKVGFEKQHHVMDFGAGTGLICSAIAPHVQSIAAVDISPSMLERLAAKPELQGKVTTVCQDILDCPIDEKFDVIVSAMAMHHVQDTDVLLQSFYEHLKDDGRVALADLDAEDGSFHPADIEGVFHDGFERSALQKKLEQAGFLDVHFETVTTVYKDDNAYPIFLVMARKAERG